MTGKKKIADTWPRDQKIQTMRSIMDNTPVPGVGGKPVHLVPEARAKILDAYATAAVAHEDQQRAAGQQSGKNNPTRGLIARVAKPTKDVRVQYARYEALAADDHVNEPVDYRQFKAVRLEILQQRK